MLKTPVTEWYDEPIISNRLPDYPDPVTDLHASPSISLGSLPLCNCNPYSGDLQSTWKGIFLQDRIICYKDYEHTGKRTLRQKAAETNLTRGQYNGYLSPKTGSKIKKFLTAWIRSVEHHRNTKKDRFEKAQAYITFATVTLAVDQHHSDNEIKRKVLTPFIKALKAHHNIRYYFWRAEAQTNGNIHFHLILDQYIHYTVLAQVWNRCQNLLGYADLYYQKVIADTDPDTLGSNPFKPPSTHIKKMPSSGKLIDYILKYVAKAPEIEHTTPKEQEATGKTHVFVQYIKDKDGNEQKIEIRKIEGRIWGCSDELREIKPFTEDLDTIIHAELQNAVVAGHARSTIEEDYWIYYLPVEEFLSQSRSKFWKSYQHHYEKTFSDLYNKPPPNSTISQPQQIPIAA